MANVSSKSRRASAQKVKAGAWVRARLEYERELVNDPEALKDARIFGGAMAEVEHDRAENLPSEIIPLLP